MQMIKWFIAVLIIAGLTILTPGLGITELDINTDLWSNLAEDQVSAFRFTGFDSMEDASEYISSDSPSDTEMGYWFEDIPWLGITAEAFLPTTNEVNGEAGIEAETDFDARNSFILFRYPDGPIRPFVGIGPTLLISDFGSKNIDSIQNLFMGFHYSF